MKYIINYILISLIFCGTLQGQEWITIENDSIPFVIESPEPLVKRMTEAMTDIGNMPVESYGIVPQKNDMNRIYQVIIFHYPAESVPIDSVELRKTILDELVLQSAEEENSELVYDGDIRAYDRNVRQWRIHNDGKLSIKSRAFFEENDLYIIQVMSDMKKSLNDDIDRFMDSFRLK